MRFINMKMIKGYIESKDEIFGDPEDLGVEKQNI
jgi:hypothetical protein